MKDKLIEGPYIDPNIASLLEEKGLKPGSYGLFFGTIQGVFADREGDEPYEESSAYFITREGRHFYMWTTWDAINNREVIDEWSEISPDPEWLLESEYRGAAQRVGQFCEHAYVSVLNKAIESNTLGQLNSSLLKRRFERLEGKDF